MRVDPEVSREKFRSEVDLLAARADLLRGMGTYVVRAEFPEIDALVVPAAFAGLGLPSETRSRGGIILPNTPQKGPTQYQIAGVCEVTRANTFGVRFMLDDFDMRAPSVTFRHPATWELLAFRHIPQAFHIVDGAAFNVVLDAHPITKVPFFCFQGVREYHEHPQHTGDEWMLYRGTHVFTLLTTLVTRVNNCMPLFVFNNPASFPTRIEWVMRNG